MTRLRFTTYCAFLSFALLPCVAQKSAHAQAVTQKAAALPLPPPAEEIDQPHPASDQGRIALSNMKIPDGFVKELWAAEPLMEDPVAFCIDEQGRIFVAESSRQEAGVEDNRSQPYWLMDDLSSQTVHDRLMMYQKWAFKRPDGMAYYSAHEDRIRLLQDTDGDGRADRSNVFAEGFHHPLDGTGSGVLAFNGNIYYTCIPNLWLLRDTNEDGYADWQTSLQYGFGVRVSLRGHDMHGLALGPDGRIYWSIGDRGYHLELPDGRVLSSPGSGAVLRSNPDGSELEVFCHGLRNPEELAFDKYGNLFTGDNNSDAGDRARLVYCVDGGETGWSMNYQTLEGSNLRGPFMQEHMWHLREPGQPAWILPPIGLIASGPSGMVYNPGVGLPAEYDDHFFLCDFRGSNDMSRVLTFAVEPDGAGFKMVDAHPFVSSVLCTDVDIGYDGKVYISDWGSGWVSKQEGRIYTVYDQTLIKNESGELAATIMKAGFTQRPVNELIDLLKHPDMRVRLRAQYALADKAPECFDPLKQLVEDSATPQLQRIHALWAMSMAVRLHKAPTGYAQEKGQLAEMIEALSWNESDPMVKAEFARVAGDCRLTDCDEVLIQMLADPNLRVDVYAANALGRLDCKTAIKPLVDMLWTNANKDLYVRNAGVVALSRIATARELLPYATDESPVVRLAIVLALRRLKDPSIATFLHDADESIVTEAARAINDLPISEDMDELAALLTPDTTGSGRSLTDAHDEEEQRPTCSFAVSIYHHFNERMAKLDAAYTKSHPDAPETSLPSKLPLDSNPLFNTPPDEHSDSGIPATRPDQADDYASRILGEITVPESGLYTFYVSSDDDSALSLSTTGEVTDLHRIAYIDGWVGPDDWEVNPTQISKPVQLSKGQTILIDARQREGGGQDHLSVGWKLPDGTREFPIGQMPDIPGNLPLLRREINANFRLGQAHHAAALLDLARRTDVPRRMRLEALDAIADWLHPSPRDRVNGYVRPLDPADRDEANFKRTLAMKLPGLIEHTSGEVATLARQIASEYAVKMDNKASYQAVMDTSLSDEDRVMALAQMSNDRDELFTKGLNAALTSDRPALRAAARSQLLLVDRSRGIEALIDAMNTGTLREQQLALADLGKLGDDNRAQAALIEWMKKLEADQAPLGLELDIYEACKTAEAPSKSVHDEVTRYEQSWPGGDPLATYRMCIEGGDAQRGKAVFHAGTAVSCIRCHTVNGTGGDAGPDLSAVADRLPHDLMLESMIEPNAKLATGYKAPSAMIPVGGKLTRQQIRDVIAYLSTLKTEAKAH